MKSSLLAIAAAILLAGSAMAGETITVQTVTDNSVVVLTGDLRAVIAYGAPNYGETPATDVREDYIALTNFGALLPKPRNGYVEEASTTIVQLVFADPKRGVTEQTKTLRKAINEFVGTNQRVQIRGHVMLAASPHHHERILVWVDDVTKVELRSAR